MATHTVTRTQVRAVREAMQLFAEEDLARRVSARDRRHCDRCRRARPAAGFILYGDAALCNRCATLYELARLRHMAASVPQFLERTDPRTGPCTAEAAPPLRG